jgi:hypothetical protein
MTNILQERAYMALQLTMSQPIEPKPRNQWHAQLLAQANQMPTSEKLWNQPVEPCRGYEYDWPENAA